MGDYVPTDAPATGSDFSDNCCVFPFEYSGFTYYQCTDAGHYAPWCATSVDSYNQYVDWMDCNEHCTHDYVPPTYAPATNAPTTVGNWDNCCYFPFMYGSTWYYSCTTAGHDGYWCATSVDWFGYYYDWMDCGEHCY